MFTLTIYLLSLIYCIVKKVALSISYSRLSDRVNIPTFGTDSYCEQTSVWLKEGVFA
jgi:hypothetical protein